MFPKDHSVRPYFKLWMAVVAGLMATLILAALFLRRSFELTALSDWIQCLLLLSGTLALLPNAVRSRGRSRAFWMLLATGMAFWFCYQAVWVYFETWLHLEVPDIFAGDMVLFLHIVPMMAAVALRPHAPQDEYSARLRRIDFALLMFWWMYLYVFAVMAWQYISANPEAYAANLNSLYLIEKIAFLFTLFVSWLHSRGGWNFFYANLFGASLTYAASSYIANWAIGRRLYYSGSLYDIPLAISMLWITVIGLRFKGCEANHSPSGSASQGVRLASLSMISLLSLPLFAAWALLEPASHKICSFRLILTLGVAVVMGLMVFLRQLFLDDELSRLLRQSRESFANLKRLQTQITESEKLASIGQLVGGAAHELNNPITALLGYSDLLCSTQLTVEQQVVAAEIGHNVRRTKSLVATLLSFAKPSSAALAPVNLNTLLQTAVRLSQPQWKGLNVEIETDLQADLRVMGDSNQLLQVCSQIVNTAIHAHNYQNTSRFVICSHGEGEFAVISIYDPNLTETAACATDAEIADLLSGLGLSACKGILQQHHGRIIGENSKHKGIHIRVEIPLILPPPELLPTGAPVPVMWQSQPSV